MALVRGKDTKPELAVRRMIWRMGFRYRLHAKDLPSKPDIVFRQRKKVIFVHGCFWHRHGDCPLTRLPKSRTAFWKKKLNANADRDSKNIGLLTRLGYRVLVVWECQLRRPQRVAGRLKRFLIDGIEKR